MVIRNKHDAIAVIKCVQQDFRSLKDGEWVPDEDSCDASITVLQAVLEWMYLPDEQGVSAVNEDGTLEPHATFDAQPGGSDDPWDEAMGGDDDDDDMSDTHKKASAIYEAKGQFAVHDAAKDGTLKVDRWAHCVPCEIESPIEDDACLVCGTYSHKK